MRAGPTSRGHCGAGNFIVEKQVKRKDKIIALV